MANTLLTISMITREAIDLFVNTNAFIKNLDRQYDDQFGKKGEKIGSSLRIRLPNDYVTRRGPAVSLQDTTEQSTTLTMSTQAGVDVEFNSSDLYLALDDFSERIMSPMMNNLTGDVATTIMQALAPTVCNMSLNVDGANAIQTPNSGTFLDAQASLKLNSAPGVGQKIVNDPRTEARVVQSLSGLLNAGSAISDQYYEGTMYRALGAIWYSDQTVIKHTAGTFTAGTVNGAGQTGTALVTNAITGTLKAGDIITIAGVNAVNRVFKDDTGELRQFVVLADVATLGIGISIYPSIVPLNAAGNKVQYQTVVASPADTAVISLLTNPSAVYRKNLRYIPQAFTMVTGDLPLPANKVTARHKMDNVSMRAITDYMIGTDVEITRFDVLFGSLAIRPEWAVIVPDKI